MPQQVATVPMIVPAPSWLKLFPRQFDIFNIGISPPKPGEVDITPCVLVSSGRMCGKTSAIVHRVIRHLWETRHARAAVFTLTAKVAKYGIWNQLLDAVKDWIDSGLYDTATGASFEFTSKDSTGAFGPKIDSGTRTIHFKVRNRFGGESELHLFSLEHDHEAEAKLLSTEFSLIWFSELKLYGDHRVLSVSRKQLRGKYVRDWQRLWIADTNPHEDGQDHWIYKLWYVDRIRDAQNIREALIKNKTPKDEVEKLVTQGLEYRKSLKLIEIKLEENIFLSEGAIIQLKEEESIAGIGEYKRNVEGLWVKGHGDRGKFFSDVFSEAIHVVGSDDENVGDAIAVAPTSLALASNYRTTPMIAGWDMGDINFATVFLERRDTDQGVIWCVLDELVLIDVNISVVDYTQEIMKKLAELNQSSGQPLVWKHWSDSSSLDVWKSGGEGGTQAMEVEASSRGQIILEPVIKPKDSVRSRVKLIRYLLAKERLYVAKCCTATIDMIHNLNRGTTQKDYVLNDKFKHPFDALSYPIYMWSLEEPEACWQLEGKPKPRSQSGVSFTDCLAAV